MKFLLLILFAGFALGNDRADLETATSVSQNLGVRNLFFNPAALAFEDELNGSQLQTSFSFGTEKEQPSEMRVGLGYGKGALGFENRHFGPHRYYRYSLGLAQAFGSRIFLGARLFLHRGELPGVSPYTGFDFGAQYRPHPMFALGIAAADIGRWEEKQPYFPGKLSAGLSFRPLEKLELRVDTSVVNGELSANLSTQASAQFEVARGISLVAGYDSKGFWQGGIRIALTGGVLTGLNSRTSERSLYLFHLDASALSEPTLTPLATGLEIDSTADLEEEGRAASFFASGQESYFGFLQRLSAAGRNPETRHVLLKLNHFPLGLGAAEELHDTLQDLRQRGKTVSVSLGNAGLKEYFIATAANQIFLDPSGSLRLIRPRSERYYLKGTLDKLGVAGEIIAKGQYKSAPEMFTRKTSSEPARQNTLAVLSSTENLLLQRMHAARPQLPKSWNELEGLVFYSGTEAKQKGLIDDVASYEMVKEEKLKEIRFSEFAELARRDLALPPRISVVVASGDILERSRGQVALLGRDALTPQKLDKLLSAAVSDPRTVGIVLRVASPGGEILPSQEMSELVRRAAEKKPIYVSMGDVAASGGYFISAPAKKIFIPGLGLTGSIGVFTGKPVLAGLYRKIDLQKETISQSPYAGILSEHKFWSNEERAIVQRQVDNYYGGFVAHVARFRKKEAPEIEKLAQGRVWTGAQAKGSLVDETGGVQNAVTALAKELGLSNDYEAHEVTLSGNPFDLMAGTSFFNASGLMGPFGELERQVHWQDRHFAYWWPGSALE